MTLRYTRSEWNAIHAAIDEADEQWEPGPPPGVSREQLREDRRRVESHRCPECERHPLRFTPEHCGNVYLPLGYCPRCEGQVVLKMRLVPDVRQKKAQRRRRVVCR